MMVCIQFESEEEKKRVAEQIHNQLVGNQDYIDSMIGISGVNSRYTTSFVVWNDTDKPLNLNITL